MMLLLVRKMFANAATANDEKKSLKKQTVYYSACVNLIVPKARNTLLLILARNIVIESLNFFHTHRYNINIADLCFSIRKDTVIVFYF